VRRAGKLYSVTQIDRWWRSDQQPWLKGTPIKKDGTPGLQSQYILGSWKIIDQEERWTGESKS